MPWHHQRMYIELLIEEIEQEQKQSEGQSNTQRVNAAGDLSGSPFNVTRV